MNCSLPESDIMENLAMTFEFGCVVMDLTLNYFSKGEAPRLNCSVVIPHAEGPEAQNPILSYALPPGPRGYSP